MEEILTYIKQNKIVFIVLFLITVGGAGYFMTHQTKKPVQNSIRTEASPVKKTTQKSSQPAKTSILVVDVQGAVKNSGVY